MKILLVEDHEDVRDALCEVLRSADHDVTEVCDGEEASKRLEEEKYDVMITDIMMPNKTGFDLISEIRENGTDIKVIAISGGGNYLTSELTTHLASLQADKSLAKPFMPMDILQAVKELEKAS